MASSFRWPKGWAPSPRLSSPRGGRRAGRLDRALLPEPRTLYDVLEGIRAKEITQHKSMTSLYYLLPTLVSGLPFAAIHQLLPTWRHLHLVAPPAGGRVTPIPTFATECIRLLPRLSSLTIENFVLTGQFNFRTWAPSVQNLVLEGCKGTDDIFRKSQANRDQFVPPNLASLDISPDASDSTFEGICAIVALSHLATTAHRGLQLRGAPR